MSHSGAALRRLTKELTKLADSPLDGIRVVINEDDITDVQAWIEGPVGTGFHGGYFRLRLVFGTDYPNAPPKGYFVTKIYHPNVAANGEICVSTLKKDWRKDLKVSDVLITIRCLLIYPNPESALNEDAGKMLLEDYEGYVRNARIITNIHAKRRPAEFDIPSVISSEPASASAGASASTSKSALSTSLQSAPSTSNSDSITSPTPIITDDSSTLHPSSSSNPTITPKKRPQPSSHPSTSGVPVSAATAPSSSALDHSHLTPLPLGASAVSNSTAPVPAPPSLTDDSPSGALTESESEPSKDVTPSLRKPVPIKKTIASAGAGVAGLSKGKSVLRGMGNGPAAAGADGRREVERTGGKKLGSGSGGKGMSATGSGLGSAAAGAKKKALKRL